MPLIKSFKRSSTKFQSTIKGPTGLWDVSYMFFQGLSLQGHWFLWGACVGLLLASHHIPFRGHPKSCKRARKKLSQTGNLGQDGGPTALEGLVRPLGAL